MVRGDTVNVCGVCGDEILGRDEIEAIVRGQSRLRVGRAYVRWNTYVSRQAFMYEPFGGVTGSHGAVRNIVCGCNVDREEKSPAMLMIREEYREIVRSVFGEHVSVPFLFKLPVSMVAWENSAFVSVECGGELPMLSERGLALVDVIADMAMEGMFRVNAEEFTVDQVLGSFTYLLLVKPAYRSFVAADLGADVSIGKLFATLPVSWIDAAELQSLDIAQSAEGKCVVKRIVGMPVAEEMIESRSIRGGFAGASVVGRGTSIAAANTCVQVFPSCGQGQVDTITVEPGGSADVVVGAGQLFVPAGRVRLTAIRSALTFEPGTVVYTAAGTRIRAVGAAVTLFVDGVIEVDVVVRDMYMDAPACAVGRMVHVCVDSYAVGTRLAEWYAERFDGVDFMRGCGAMRVDAILLHAPDRGTRDIEVPKRSGLDPVPRDWSAYPVLRADCTGLVRDGVGVVTSAGPCVVLDVTAPESIAVELEGVLAVPKCVAVMSVLRATLVGFPSLRASEAFDGDCTAFSVVHIAKSATDNSIVADVYESCDLRAKYDWVSGHLTRMIERVADATSDDTIPPDIHSQDYHGGKYDWLCTDFSCYDKSVASAVRAEHLRELSSAIVEPAVIAYQRASGSHDAFRELHATDIMD